MNEVSLSPQLQLDDVARLGAAGSVVVSGLPDDVRVDCPPAADAPASGAPLPTAVSRAIVAARIASLQASSGAVRGELLGALASSLNADMSGAAALSLSEANLGQQMVDLATAFGCAPTDAESAILRRGQFAEAGALAAGMAIGSEAALAADCAAALSMEAAGGFDLQDFAEMHFDERRQHRGMMLSANNLRLLLAGSGRAKAQPAPGLDAGRVGDFRALARLAPQLHGPAADALAAASKVAQRELGLSEASDRAPSYHPSQLWMAMDSAVSAFEALCDASRGRVAALWGEAAQAAAPAAGLARCYGAAVALRAAVERESSLADGAIVGMEEAAKEARERAAAAQAAKRAANAEREAKMKAEDDAKLAAMTPAQREKVLEKRRKKAEKAAQKAAKKGDSSANAEKGVPLAWGTRTVREVLKVGNHAELAKALEGLASGGAQRKPRIAKGTRDFHPSQMAVRERAFGIIRNVFKRHGAQEIDTPVFELKDTLTGKYGEDTKLIYDLADQGGEILALRYDLTVPFARYLALHNPGNMKRFHMAKVYRRDNPQLSRGRYREFYQCDFDVSGSYETMVADAEVVTVCVEILSDLPIGDIKIKLNDRRLLDAIFETCGCPPEKFRTICSAVDKLDKEPWATVRQEMLDKGLDEGAADRIGRFVTRVAPAGEPSELLDALEGELGAHPTGGAAIRELRVLFAYLDAMGSAGKVSLDMSLARGLDYYTGVIYEAVLMDSSFGVGSIAAGGRYDNLVGMFSGSATPCVGVSIGVERVFAIMERMQARDGVAAQAATCQVVVASMGDNMVHHRMAIARELWNADISAEFGMGSSKKLVKQLQDALERGVPYMVVIGDAEVSAGTVKIKNMAKKTERSVSREDLVAVLLEEGAERTTGARTGGSAAAGAPPLSLPSLDGPVQLTATQRFAVLDISG